MTTGSTTRCSGGVTGGVSPARAGRVARQRGRGRAWAGAHLHASHADLAGAHDVARAAVDLPLGDAARGARNSRKPSAAAGTGYTATPHPAAPAPGSRTGSSTASSSSWSERCARGWRHTSRSSNRLLPARCACRRVDSVQSLHHIGVSPHRDPTPERCTHAHLADRGGRRGASHVPV